MRDRRRPAGERLGVLVRLPDDLPGRRHGLPEGHLLVEDELEEEVRAPQEQRGGHAVEAVPAGGGEGGVGADQPGPGGGVEEGAGDAEGAQGA